MLLKKKILLLFIINILALTFYSNAQIADTAVARKLYLSKDTVKAQKEENVAFKETDSAKLKNPNARIPKKAAIRSAIIPGWGQVYNKKIWKVPIVYALIGSLGYYFAFNHKYYKDYQLATGVIMAFQNGSTDSSGYYRIKDPYAKKSALTHTSSDYATIRDARDWYKQKRDYAAVYFLAGWLLNVIDATVDAHLSTFDINPNLTMKIEPGYSELGKTNGLSLVLKFK